VLQYRFNNVLVEISNSDTTWSYAVVVLAYVLLDSNRKFPTSYFSDYCYCARWLSHSQTQINIFNTLHQSVLMPIDANHRLSIDHARMLGHIYCSHLLTTFTRWSWWIARCTDSWFLQSIWHCTGTTPPTPGQTPILWCQGQPAEMVWIVSCWQVPVCTGRRSQILWRICFEFYRELF